MTKVYTREFEYCRECPYLSTGKWCIKRIGFVTDNKVPDPCGEIPEWCPLPDKEKEGSNAN